MRRLPAAIAASVVGLSSLRRGPDFACGGLIGPNGAVNLLRTTTFAGYHEGVEHYVTAFQFAGGGGAFGSHHAAARHPEHRREGRRLDPPAPHPRDRARPVFDGDLVFAARGRRPGRRGADGGEASTRSTSRCSRAAATRSAQWAKDHGFRLPPDAPEVLDFYAKRSPIFLAAAFDADAAARARPGRRRRHARPHHDPDPEPVGAAAHPGPRQGRRGARRGGRLPADRPRAGAPSGRDDDRALTLDHSAPASDIAARRPALRPGHGVGPRLGLAEQDRHRRGGGRPALRPRRRRQRPGHPIPARSRARSDGGAAARRRRRSSWGCRSS